LPLLARLVLGRQQGGDAVEHLPLLQLAQRPASAQESDGDGAEQDPEHPVDEALSVPAAYPNAYASREIPPFVARDSSPLGDQLVDRRRQTASASPDPRPSP
jgi:hypothetical protein